MLIDTELLTISRQLALRSLPGSGCAKITPSPEVLPPFIKYSARLFGQQIAAADRECV